MTLPGATATVGGKRASRRIGLAVAAVAVVGLSVGVWTLFDRIAEFNAERPPNIFYRQPVLLRSFEYAGRPVELTDDLDGGGRGSIVLRYGDDSAQIPVAVPNANELEGLERHEAWFTVLRIVPGEPGVSLTEALDQVEAGERQDMLVMVSRTPNPGKNDGAMGLKVDPDAWGFGEVMRKHWSFDFYMLNPAGGIEKQTLRFPSTRRHEDPKPGELVQGTWQYDAAASVMPKGSEPKANFTERALANAGWALGLSGVSVMLLAGSLAWAFAPTREQINERIERRSPA